jgi:hypothetical protein
MAYKLTQGWPQRLSDGAFVNPDTNPEYLAWLAEGNTPEPADAPPVPVITSVEMRQARLALLEQGLLTQVNNAVATMPGELGNKARIEWEFSNAVRRDKPLVQVVAASLGLTSQQIDDLFALAATL